MSKTEKELLTKLEKLRAEVTALKSDKATLEILVETVTTHADSVEAQLFFVNRQLRTEIRDRKEQQVALKASETLLSGLVRSLQREKADLELILETTTEHGDLVEELLFDRTQIEQEELFHRITEVIPVAILISRLHDRVVLYSNSATCNILGTDSSAIIGQPLPNFCHNPEDARQIQRLFRTQGAVQDYELRVKTPTQILWLNVSLHLLNLNGQQFLLLSCQNISDRRQVQEALQLSEIQLRLQTELLEVRVSERTAALSDAMETAAAANQAKSEFLASMSHELRTPLNAILGFAQILYQETSLTDEQRESIEVINQSSEHLLSLINDVLELSKIEAGRLILKEKDFNLRQLISSIFNMLNLRSQAKRLALEIEISENIPVQIYADEGKLSQVLINLLGNAIKFTNTGKVSLQVWMQPTGQEHQVQLHFAIADTGTGIAIDELEFLFQSFVQTKSGQQQKEGTGLGLAISQKFVQLMGGEIQVNSVLGKGTTFSFHVSARNVAIAPSQNLELHPGSHPHLNELEELEALEVSDFPPLKILLAEDNMVNQKIARRMLKNLGYAADFCFNGREVLAQIALKTYDLILMDVQMPELDGMATTGKIRELEREQKGIVPITIIAMTAFGLAEDRRDCLAAGMDDYLSKPVRQIELQTILSRWQRILYHRHQFHG